MRDDPDLVAREPDIVERAGTPTARTIRERPRGAHDHATMLRQVEDTTHMIFSVVEDDLVEPLVEATRSVLKEPLSPRTGIGFVLDVPRTFGTGA